MHYIPGLRLRCSDDAEIIGIDDTEMGEFAYDYVGLDYISGGGFRDDLRPTSDLAAPGGGREPKHEHLHHQGVDVAVREHEGSTGSTVEGSDEKRVAQS